MFQFRIAEGPALSSEANTMGCVAEWLIAADSKSAGAWVKTGPRGFESLRIRT